MSFDLIIKKAHIILSDSQKEGDVAIKQGKITLIDTNIDQEANQVIDASGLYLLPGIIDSQVHFREPGLTHKEDIACGSKAAALGGVTTFFEMPNTNPPTSTVEALSEKVEIAKKVSYTNLGFFMGGTGKNLEELENGERTLGCIGTKIFFGSSTGDLLLNDVEKIEQIFRTLKRPIAIHSEDENRLQERLHIKDQADSVLDHEKWRDEDVAFMATEKLISLAKKTNKKIHLLHITSKKEMEFLAENKDICTVEVTPQHLLLHSPECYQKMGTYVQMNPPIRGADHQKALWKGLEEGVVDVIGSDHAPHTKSEKERGYPFSPSGMPGVQTMFPIMLNFVNQKKLTLERMVDLLCKRPAELYGIENKGEIKEGADADLVLVDLKKTHVFSHEDMASKCGWTPFAGMTSIGMPVATIVNGVMVMKDGKLIDHDGQTFGRPVQVGR